MSDQSRVLLVDDHVMLRDAIRVALELAGHEVVGEVEKVGSGEVMLSPSLASAMLRELTARRDVRRALITKREEEALHLVADGYSTHEVASRLLVSDRAVRRDLSSAYGKLDARAAQAAFDGVRWGIDR